MPKRFLVVLMCLIMVIPAFAAQADSALEPMEVTFYLWGEQPTGMEDVIAEFESRTADTLNMKLYFDWTPIGDFPNKISLKLAAGEEVDACFDAQWMHLVTFIADGASRDLTDYFHNDAYPGLKAAFGPDLMSNNTLGTGRYYAIPFTQAFDSAHMIAIRGDLREKYGVPPVTDSDTYRQFLQAIVDNEPNMVPFATNVGRTPTWVYDSENYRLPIDRLNAGVWANYFIMTNFAVDMYIEDYELKAVWFKGEPESFRADFPDPYKTFDLDKYEMAYDWFEKGYVDPDAMTVTDGSGQFTSGKGASLYWDAANYLAISNALAASVPESQLEWYIVNPAVREDLDGMMYGNFTAWNFMCIPATTSQDKADRIMMFYDWMFSSTENHDLFEYGIEGKNFIAIGDDQYKMPEGLDASDVYALPGYQFTWNANFIRLSADMPPDVLAANKKCNDPATYYNPIMSGFTFQTADVETAIANPDFAVFADEWALFERGLVGDPATAAAALFEKYGNNAALMEDTATIKAEFIKQFQEHLDARKLLDAENGTVYPK